MLMFFVIGCGKKNLKPINFSMDFEALISHVATSEKLLYWEFSETNRREYTRVVKYSYGDQAFKASFRIRPKEGFFEGLDGDSYSFIAFVPDGSDRFEFIVSIDGLISFIGEIDNIEEALILAYLKGYYPDMEFPDYTPAFKVLEDDSYVLRLTKFDSCPVLRESFLLNVSKKGISSIKSLGVFYERPEECWLN